MMSKKEVVSVFMVVSCCIRYLFPDVCTEQPIGNSAGDL